MCVLHVRAASAFSRLRDAASHTASCAHCTLAGGIVTKMQDASEDAELERDGKVRWEQTHVVWCSLGWLDGTRRPSACLV